VFFVLAEGTGLFGRRLYKDVEEDRSASSHEALLRVGVAVALDRGFTGIGHEHFEEVSLGYVDVAQQDDQTNGVQAIGIDRPHNDFLSVWISWGFLALVVYICIFVNTLRNLKIAARSPDVLIRGLSVGCAGGVIVYAVNSAFHNSMDNSLVLWLYAGFSVALARMSIASVRELRRQEFQAGREA
jgi:O-antigen ligase